MPQSPLRTSSTTTHVTPRMFSPSIETIASVRRATICPFCSGVNTSSISLTLMSGMALLVLVVLDEGRQWCAGSGSRRACGTAGAQPRDRQPDAARRPSCCGATPALGVSHQVVDVLLRGDVGESGGGH